MHNNTQNFKALTQDRSRKFFASKLIKGYRPTNIGKDNLIHDDNVRSRLVAAEIKLNSSRYRLYVQKFTLTPMQTIAKRKSWSEKLFNSKSCGKIIHTWQRDDTKHYITDLYFNAHDMTRMMKLYEQGAICIRYDEIQTSKKVHNINNDIKDIINDISHPNSLPATVHVNTHGSQIPFDQMQNDGALSWQDALSTIQSIPEQRRKNHPNTVGVIAAQRQLSAV